MFYHRYSNIGSNENERAATSSEIQQTLDTPRTEESTLTNMRHTPKHWQGIEPISYTTPSFKALLSEGDRLYEIMGQMCNNVIFLQKGDMHQLESASQSPPL